MSFFPMYPPRFDIPPPLSFAPLMPVYEQRPTWVGCEPVPTLTEARVREIIREELAAFAANSAPTAP